MIPSKCRNCGKEKILYTITKCRTCIMKYRKQRLKTEIKRKKYGICTCCGIKKINKKISIRFCEQCNLRKIHHKRIGYYKKAKNPNKARYEESMKFLYGEQPKTI
jgi:hypothetical protein